MPQPRMEWWDGMGIGTSGAPTTPSISWSSALRQSTDEAERWSTCERIHAIMLVQRVPKCLLLLRPPPPTNISSGMGTSSTVSRPSSRSRLGHSFLIEEGGDMWPSTFIKWSLNSASLSLSLQLNLALFLNGNRIGVLFLSTEAWGLWCWRIYYSFFFLNVVARFYISSVSLSVFFSFFICTPTILFILLYFKVSNVWIVAFCMHTFFDILCTITELVYSIQKQKK